MARLVLFRQRNVWVPTILGWLSLLLITIVVFMFGVRSIYPFLAQNESVGARILVVEGWLAPEELDQAAQVFKKGGYERVITTGGPISGWPELFLSTSYAKVAADYLAEHGVPRGVITVIPTPRSAQERTFLSAVVLRDSGRRLGITFDAIDIFSSGAHARRSRLLFQMAFGQMVRIGVLSAHPDGYLADAWWKSSGGVESVFFQSVGLIWVKCCFWPGPPGSRQELWAIP